MKRFNVETAVGLFVLAGIAAIAWLSIRLGKLEIVGGNYVPVRAEFASVAGLKKGASVEIAGVEVGKVDAIVLDNYRADVLMKVRKGVALQDDAIASVRTMGLIGDKYVSISPGASDRLIPPGGTIRETESPPDFDQLIGELIHGSAK
ncbi:MAG: outer membrane lipid asymmetry maintenance protein MlaD [Gemmatimonadota bacterium]